MMHSWQHALRYARGFSLHRHAALQGAHPFVRKGTMRYKVLMLGHLDNTALLNSFSCTCTLGILLLRLASIMAVATAVKTMTPVRGQWDC